MRKVRFKVFIKPAIKQGSVDADESEFLPQHPIDSNRDSKLQKNPIK